MIQKPAVLLCGGAAGFILMRQAEGLAQPGTQAHWQIVSAALMTQWPRIQFCLDVLEKEKTAATVNG